MRGASDGQADGNEHAKRFLREFFGACEDEHGRLSAYLVIRNRRSRECFWTREVALAAELAMDISNAHHDVDFHVALHDFDARVRAEGKDIVTRRYRGIAVTFLRGLIVTATVLFFLWIDIDYGTAGHAKKNLPPDRASALQVLRELERVLGMEFSIVVDTGGGFHAYILFREPWILESDADRDRATRLCSALQRRSGIAAADLGVAATGQPWEHDSTADLARVLRVAGTCNWKTSAGRAVRVIQRTETRVDPSELEEHPALVESLDPPRVPRSLSPAKTRRPTSDDLESIRIKLEKELRGSPLFARTWRHERDAEMAGWQQREGRPVDTSMSVYDHHLVVLGSRAGWDDQELRELLDLHYVERGGNPRTKTEQYYRRTIAHARREPRRAEIPWAPDAPKATRPIIRTKADLTVVEDVAASWVPGDESVVVSGWPGIGKTTVFGRHAMQRLSSEAKGWECGVAVLVLPTRDLVHEKAKELREFGSGLKATTRVLLGRSADWRSGWYCREAVRYRNLSELRRPSCKDCTSLKRCLSKPGSYLYELTRVLQRLEFGRRGVPLLLVTTRELLPFSWDKIPKKAPIILDDAGARFGLITDWAFRHDDLLAACEFIDRWIASTCAKESVELAELLHDAEQEPDGSRQELHLALVGDLVHRVLQALQSVQTRRGCNDRLTKAIHALPPAYHRAILGNRVRPILFDDGRVDAWPWESDQDGDGPDLRPRFTDAALTLARLTLEGRPPLAYRADRKGRARGEPEYHVLLGDSELIRRAQDGRVAWLGVGPMPEQVLAALGARQEVILAEPENLRAVVGLVPSEASERKATYVSFGPANKGDEPVADEITRGLCRGMEAKAADGGIHLGDHTFTRFGAVVHKADWEELGQPEHFAYYGRDHASTNALNDRDVLVVRRHVPPLEAIRIDAEALRRALGIERPAILGEENRQRGKHDEDPTTCLEKRCWEGSPVEFVTRVPVDSLEREIQRFHELHHQLNAVGRCRPLTSTSPCLVLLLAGRPFDWIRPRLRHLTSVLAEIGLKLDLPDPDTRQANLRSKAERQRKEADERRANVVQILRKEGPQSVRALAAQLKASPRSIGNDLRTVELAELWTWDHFGQSDPLILLKDRFAQTDPAPRLPSLGDVVAEIGRSGSTPLAIATIKRRLADLRRGLAAGSELLLPRRSDAARSLLVVVEAVQRLLGRREPGEDDEVTS